VNEKLMSRQYECKRIDRHGSDLVEIRRRNSGAKSILRGIDLVSAVHRLLRLTAAAHRAGYDEDPPVRKRGACGIPPSFRQVRKILPRAACAARCENMEGIDAAIRAARNQEPSVGKKTVPAAKRPSVR